MTLGETFISLGLSSTEWLVLNYSTTPYFLLHLVLASEKYPHQDPSLGNNECVCPFAVFKGTCLSF